MSLALDIDKVTAVLLSDRRWYSVMEKSFVLDAFEFIFKHEEDDDGEIVHGGGNSGICATGFRFKTSEPWPYEEKSSFLLEKTNNTFFISGPLTSILAVKINNQKQFKLCNKV